jgi:hypothetical protein
MMWHARFDTLARDLVQFSGGSPSGRLKLDPDQPGAGPCELGLNCPVVEEVLMRRPVWMILTIAVLFLGASGGPARAQTYDPHYPFCLQTYGITGNGIHCRYMSMAACQVSASGQAAQCIANPYYGHAPSRRRHQAY